MARYIQEYLMQGTVEHNRASIGRLLTVRGYTVQQYRDESVYCKGSAAIGNETMVQVSFPTGTVRVEAWLKTMGIPGIVDGEQDIEGYYGWAVKGELKSVVVELDRHLGGAPNRIGTHPYLAKKDAEGGQSQSFSEQLADLRQRVASSFPRMEERRKPTVQQRASEPVMQPRPQPVQRPEPQPAPAPQPVPSPQPAESGVLVDINQCTQSELMSLPGIGVAQAKKALEYRTEHGGFRSVDEFVEVLEIKPHFAVQIFAKATASQAAAAPKPQPTSTAARRKFDI